MFWPERFHFRSTAGAHTHTHTRKSKVELLLKRSAFFLLTCKSSGPSREARRAHIHHCTHERVDLVAEAGPSIVFFLHRLCCEKVDLFGQELDLCPLKVWPKPVFSFLRLVKPPRTDFRRTRRCSLQRARSWPQNGRLMHF